MNNEKLVLSIVAGLSLGATAPEATPKKETEPVQCYGISKKAGDNGCSFSKSEIAAANEVYKNKFSKSKANDSCAGMVDCAAKKGILSWISKPTKDSCFAEGGFLISKDEDRKGKFIIEDKEGKKKSS